jgi:hypothetical protein
MNNPAPAKPCRLSNRIGDARRVRHCNHCVVLALELFDCESGMHQMMQGEPECAGLNRRWKPYG